MRIIAADLQFPEGPVPLADGSVLVVEMAGGRLTRVWDEGRTETVAELGGGPNGAAVGPDGRIYVANSGGFYFTDSGKLSAAGVEWGALYYAQADGSGIHAVAGNLLSPNGVGLSPDGKALFVTETITAALWAWEVSSPGVVRTLNPEEVPHGGRFVIGGQPPALRQPGAHRLGPRAGRNAHQRRHHRDLARHPDVASLSDVRRRRHQRRLRRAGASHRLRDARRDRAARSHGLARARPRPGPRRLNPDYPTPEETIVRIPTIAVIAATLLGAAFATPASAQPPPDSKACAPGDELRFVCGLPAPEDLIKVPGSPFILASGLVDPSAESPAPFSGGLALIDSANRTGKRITPTAGRARAPYTDFATPPDPAQFSAHGMNLKTQRDGRSLLYVVGHGGREAIEVYKVISRGKRAPSLTWIGAVRAPEGSFFNSVVDLRDGHLIATDFLRRPATFEDIGANRPTGAVYAWTPGGSWRKLPGTKLSGANGVEVSPDERHLFVAVNGNNTVLRYRLAATERRPDMVKPGFLPDNLRYAPDGRLLVAGPKPDPACEPDDDACPQISVVKALDTRTLALETVARIPAEPAFPELSSALIVGSRLWLGSPSGDRAAYIKVPSGGR